MKLISIHLRGAKGIKEGLGVDDLELDLSSLHGIVMLDGHNGMGKTTLLDNLQPFRFLPSRSKKALQHHFFLRDSFRDLVFDHGDHRYRCLIKIDPEAGAAGKQEGFIYVDGAEKSEVTGKVREYDEFINKLLGSQDLVMSSIFCAQKTDDSQMTVGAMKKQYAEFLRLHEYQQRSDTSKMCENEISTVIANIVRNIDQVKEKKGLLDSAPAGLKTKISIIEKTEQDLKSISDKLEAMRKRLELLNQEKSDNNVAIERRNNLKQRIADAKTNFEKEREKHTESLSTLREEVKTLKTAIKNNQKIISDKGKILGAKEKLKEISAKMKDIEVSKLITNKDIDTTQADITAQVEYHATVQKDLAAELEAIRVHGEKLSSLRRKMDKALSKITAEITSLENDKGLAVINAHIERANEMASALDERDPECGSDKCKFIVDAIAAKKALPSLIENRDQRSAKVASELCDIRVVEEMLKIEGLKLDMCSQENDLHRIEVEDYKSNNDAVLQKRKVELNARIKTLREKVQKHDQALTGLVVDHEIYQSRVEFVPKIEVAQQRIADLTAQLNDIESRIVSMEQGFSALESRNKESNNRIEAEIEAMDIKDNIDSDISDLLELIAKRNIDFSEKQEELSSLKTDKAVLAKDVEALNSIDAEHKALVARRDELTRHMTEWAYLKINLGKNGLQAIEIDSVAPMISNTANQMLAATFGSKFQVRIETLTDAGKETMEIWVIRDNGTEALLEDLSGGEKVWVLKALRLARTSLAKEKSGNDYRTCFGDEEDGALRHGETSENFIELYRKFIEMANFDTAIIISHKPECIAMADMIIEFGDNSASIQ